MLNGLRRNGHYSCCVLDQGTARAAFVTDTCLIWKQRQVERETIIYIGDTLCTAN
jgi:hypothetical protein